MEKETPSLTKREMEVLSLAEYGNKETAYLLGISKRVVRNHWTMIYRKLIGKETGPARSKRTRAVFKALRIGLITVNQIKEVERCVTTAEEGLY